MPNYGQNSKSKPKVPPRKINQDAEERYLAQIKTIAIQSKNQKELKSENQIVDNSRMEVDAPTQPKLVVAPVHQMP